MLINMLIKDRVSSRGFCLLRSYFSKMPYYRQMAQKLNISIPKLNDQVIIENTGKCMVYGIKEIPAENFTDEDKQLKERKVKYFDEESFLGFIVDKNSREEIDFNLAKRIAMNLELDICLMKEQEKSEQVQNNNLQGNQDQSLPQSGAILSLQRFREHIYRQYYLKELKNKSRKKYIEKELTHQLLLDKSEWSPSTPGSFKNRTKSVRIGEDAHINDMKNKKAQIIRWIEQGQRTVKVVANNATDKSYKAVQKFCSLFEKEVEIIEEKIQNDLRKKPVIRLYATLQFEDEVAIDFDFINKRWRRREAEIKLNQEGRSRKPSMFDIDLTEQGAEIQKAYLAAFDQAGIPYPKKYKFLSQLDKGFEKQGIMSLVRSVFEQGDRKRSEGGDQDQEILSEEQQKKRDKQNRQFMEMKNVEDILEEMEEIKSREYEMEQYESSKYKELEKELTEMLKNAKKYAEKTQP